MNDLQGYIKGLDKSMTRKEKLFFLDKVKLGNYDYIIDFGGANGRLLYEVDKYMNKKGIDKYKKITLINVEQNNDIVCDYNYTRNYRQYDTLPIFKIGTRILLICSSVLHECKFSMIIKLSRFIHKYVNTVVIRDMYLDDKIPRDVEKPLNNIIRGLSESEFVRLNDIKANNIDMFNRLGCCYPEFMKPIIAAYEYFLKYTYIQNWETEVREQYFNIHARRFIKKLLADYKVKYQKRYILPYKKNQVKKDFNYTMCVNTHIQIIVDKEYK